MEPELVCVDKHGKASGLGLPAADGFLFQTSLNLVRKVLSPSCSLIKALGEHLKFETAIGMNGRIWVKGQTVKETIIISNAISLVENMTEDEIKIMVGKLVGAMAAF
ncbi:Exosome component 3 [Chamberlinius hualienensis]